MDVQWPRQIQTSFFLKRRKPSARAPSPIPSRMSAGRATYLSPRPFRNTTRLISTKCVLGSADEARRAPRESVPMGVISPARKKLGTENWVKEEENRYKCPHCGDRLFRGARRCGSCKELVEID